MTLTTSRQRAPSTPRLRTIVAAAAVILYTGAFLLTPIAALGRHPKTGAPFDRLGLLLWQLFHLPDLASEWLTASQGLVSLTDRLPIFGFAVVVLGVAYGMGRGMLNALGLLHVLSRAERIVFGIGLGLNALSLTTLLVGLLGWLREPLGIAILGAMATLLLALNWTTGKLRGRTLQDEPRSSMGSVEWLMLAAVVAFTMLILLGSLLPPWHFDVRAYHLQAPKEWYQAGAIRFLPHNVYANMPLGAEMHALLAMMLWPGEHAWWSGAIVGKVVIASFAPLTALALYAFGRRFLTPTIGLAAAFLFITTPWVAYLSFAGLIECVLGFYLLLGFYALALRSRLQDEPTTAAHTCRSLMIVSGLCAGAAVACKYPAIVFVLLPLLTLAAFPKLLCLMRLTFTVPSSGSASGAWGRVFEPPEPGHWGLASLDPSHPKDRNNSVACPAPHPTLRIPLAAVCVFVLSAFAACGPWYLKNAAQTGNPTYPLLSGVFGQGDWSEGQHERWSTAHRPPADQLGRRYTIGHFLQSAVVLGWCSTGHSVVLVPLAAVAIFARPRRKFVLPLVLFVLYFIVVWWLVTHRFGRFVTPLLPAMALLASVGVASIMTKRARPWLAAFLVVVALSNALLTTSSVLGDNRFFMPLAEARSSRVSVIHRFLNESLGENDRVLLVGDATPFELEVSHLYNTCFDHCHFTRMMQGKTAAGRRAALSAAGVTHVYISWADIAAYRRQGDYGYSPYVNRERVHEELVRGDQILEAVSTGVDPQRGELFRVTDDTGE